MRPLCGTLLPDNFIVLPISKQLRAICFSIKSSFILTVLGLLISIVTFSQNDIVTENALPGNPASEWDVVGAGDPTIQGFSTELSVNKGTTVFFKIKTDATDYDIAIYRIGYYQGNGARFVTNGVITASLPQIQPQPLYESATGKTDCGNWEESAQWNVPSTAVSGVYIAKLTRKDNRGSSHIIFIVRDDAKNSNLLFKTSDATWQAYNNYGGNSLYGYISSIPVPGFKQSVKLSYNRPFSTRGGNVGLGLRESYFFNAEYAMIRWLERNGYELSYTTQIDIARRTSPFDPTKHKVLLSVGHDEYWSAEERAIYTSARNAGVNLAFFSGNEVYWKIRWEDNCRTLVCYKEKENTNEAGYCNGKCDPNQNVWTGLWRAGCTFADADGCKPENELTGQLSFNLSAASITVPSVYKKNRFWRNTSIASVPDGQSITLIPNSLGYEWDQEQQSTSYPAGRVILSNTLVGTDVHRLSLYRHRSKALVFGAGTINWAYGLDGVHDIVSSNEDVNMQQATVNLFADMGAQPGSLQSNLVPASSSDDVLPPSSKMNVIPSTTKLIKGKAITISGTATDFGGGVVGGVEISINGGISWVSADGTENWNYTFTPTTEGQIDIVCRSFDDLGNLESISSVNSMTIKVLPSACPCTLFQPTDVAKEFKNDGKPIEVGMKFKSNVNGQIKSIRYYKIPGNGGTVIGHLWKTTSNVAGDLLAQVTFTNQTASGWQEMALPKSIPIVAGQTYSVTIYNSRGDYNVTRPFFNVEKTSFPLVGLMDKINDGNGVYNYDFPTITPVYPYKSYQQTNYWVDVVFVEDQSSNLPIISQDPVSSTNCIGKPATFTATATSSTMPSIQWQVSSNNISWTNIANSQSETLTVVPAIADNGKYYRAAFSNAAGTVYTKSATLIVSMVSTEVASQTNASCVGGDGAITLSATGGIAPYIFNINGGVFQQSAQFSNLNAGIYTFEVKDAIGCTASLSNVSVSQNPGINITLASKKDVTCLGNDGTISVNAIDGTAPFSFNLNGSDYQSSNEFSNLTPGVYNVMANDVNGCSAVLAPVTIVSNPALTIDLITKSDVSCLGNYGSITVGVTGGTAPYTFSINGGTFQTSNVFLNLEPGSYNIIVKDATGCNSTLPPINIVLKAQILLEVLSKTDANCASNDGTIAVTATGGVAPYSYSKNGVDFQSSSIFNNLAPADYTITVKDAMGCLTNLSGVIIGNNNILSNSLSGKIDATCGLKDGSITVSGSCGVAPFRYVLSTGINQTSGTFSNLAPGTYDIYVIDASGNSAVVSGVIVSENKTVALTASKIVNETCTYGDGAVTLTATGGKSPYQYKMGTGSYGTGNTFAGLKAGDYSFSVKDNNGCITTITSKVLNVPSNLTLVVTDKANASCAGGDGYITVNATGGSGNYTFNINGGTYQTGKTFRLLKEGTYVTSVKDSKGCIVSLADIQLSRTSFIATLASVTNISCKGSDGSIELNTTGGTPSYVYSLNGSSYSNADKELNNLKAGTHYVTVRDSKGCISVVRDIVLVRAATLSATVDKTNACKNINNGSITINANGGIPPYQYSLNGASYKTSNLFSNLAPGTYYIRVRDAKGCNTTVSGISITRLTTTCSGRGYEGYVTNPVKNNVNVVENGVEASASMSIFPNPSTGNIKLNIKNMDGFQANVVIVDALGKEIYKVQTNIRSDFDVLPIYLDRIHKGIYFVKLSTTKASLIEKLLIY